VGCTNRGRTGSGEEGTSLSAVALVLNAVLRLGGIRLTLDAVRAVVVAERRSSRGA
jgi:hypothetical protein